MDEEKGAGDADADDAEGAEGADVAEGNGTGSNQSDKQIVPATAGPDDTKGLSLELLSAVSICGRCQCPLDPIRAHQKSERLFHCSQCNSRGVQLRSLDNWDEVQTMLTAATPADEATCWESIANTPKKKDVDKIVTHMSRVSCREPF